MLHTVHACIKDCQTHVVTTMWWLLLYRLLVSILEESSSPLAVSVACFDVGEYVRYYPRGKKLVSIVVCSSVTVKIVGVSTLWVQGNTFAGCCSFGYKLLTTSCRGVFVYTGTFFNP